MQLNQKTEHQNSKTQTKSPDTRFEKPPKTVKNGGNSKKTAKKHKKQRETGENSKQQISIENPFISSHRLTLGFLQSQFE